MAKLVTSGLKVKTQYLWNNAILTVYTWRPYTECFDITIYLCLLMLSADNLSNQFGPRPGTTKG